MADEGAATLETIYERLAEAIDAARAADAGRAAECESLFLAKLALAALREAGSAERAERLIADALAELARSLPGDGR